VDAPSVQAPLATDAKTAVDRVRRGKERRVNMRFLAMANHYVFEPAFCNPAAGWGETLFAIGSRTMVERSDREECAGFPASR